MPSNLKETGPISVSQNLSHFYIYLSTTCSSQLEHNWRNLLIFKVFFTETFCRSNNQLFSTTNFFVLFFFKNTPLQRLTQNSVPGSSYHCEVSGEEVFEI